VRECPQLSHDQVCLIFLCSGAGLKTKVLLSAASAWRLHLARARAVVEAPDTHPL
jgi:predicted Na+-dependent transporter